MIIDNTLVIGSRGQLTSVTHHDPTSKIVTPRTIGERMALARNLLELTQQELAHRAGVSQGTVGNIESNARRAPRDLLRFARVLGVSPDWLSTGAGPMKGATAEPAWPFELLSRDQWEALSERQRGAVEAAAVRAANDIANGRTPGEASGTDIAAAFDAIPAGDVRDRLRTMLIGALQDPATHLAMMGRLLGEAPSAAATTPAHHQSRPRTRQT